MSWKRYRIQPGSNRIPREERGKDDGGKGTQINGRVQTMTGLKKKKWPAQTQQVWGDFQKNSPNTTSFLPNLECKQEFLLSICTKQVTISNYASVKQRERHLLSFLFFIFLTKVSSISSFNIQWFTWTTRNLPYFATLGLLGGRMARARAGKFLFLIESLWWHAVPSRSCTRWHWYSPYSFTAAGGFIQGTNYLIAANVPYIYSAANLQDGAWLTRRG